MTTPRQLPLDLGHEPGYARDDLIVADSNRAAVELIDSWPQWPSPFVILAGPTGAGKTHLAAIWKANSGAVVVDPKAIDKDDLEQAECGPVLIDNIGGEPMDETGLFHLMNVVRQSGSTMLMTSRRWPINWPVKLPDLASRLKAASTVEISEPDDFLLTAVIHKLFADRQVSVEPQLVSYLVSRIERSLSTASRVVDKLDRAALEHQTRITRSLAASVINAIDEGQSDLGF